MLGKKTLTDLKAVMYLYAVGGYEGKRKAARELDVSIDTLSKYIDGLEEECGSKLLNTAGTGSVLTLRGERICRWAAEIEKELNIMYELVSEKDVLKGEIKMAWGLNARAAIISGELWDFLRKHKDITLSSSTVRKIDELKSMNCDVALTTLPPNFDGWEVMNVKDIQTGFFASTSYLRKYGYPIDINDMLNNHRMVFMRKGDAWANGEHKFLEKSKRPLYLTDTSYAVKEAITNGMGIGILPQSFTRKGLVCLDNIKTGISGQISLSIKTSSKNIKRVRVLAEYLRSILDRA
ncbi:MAG: LysR family transcriptional regulator [Alphaproteobacteria bacterium]|nr:LysR family transcriptional regulator [Alphaproteobacteria bacterium]